MKLHLDPIRKIAEGLTMGDTVQFESPPQRDEASWNEALGRYNLLVPTIFYGPGPGSIYSAGSGRQLGDRGGRQVHDDKYWIAIPTSAEVFVPAETVVRVIAVDSENGDPEMVDKLFRIEVQEFGTLTATRRFTCYLLTDIP